MSSIHYDVADASLLRQLREAKKYCCYIAEGAELARVSASIVFGIGSRESGWGIFLNPKGPGGTGDASPRRATAVRKGGLPPDGKGFGRGLMQIDWDAHPFARNGDWADPRENILYGCQVLRDSIAFFVRKKDILSPEVRSTFDLDAVLRAGISGYNTGMGNALKSLLHGKDPDTTTAHGNYCKDVLARSDWFTRVGGWNKE